MVMRSPASRARAVSRDAEELHFETESPCLAPAEGCVRRLVAGLGERGLDAFVLGGVTIDQGETEAQVKVPGADMPGTGWVQDEQTRDDPADEHGVLRGEAEGTQETGRLAENRVEGGGVVAIVMHAVRDMIVRPVSSQ